MILEPGRQLEMVCRETRLHRVIRIGPSRRCRFRVDTTMHAVLCVACRWSCKVLRVRNLSGEAALLMVTTDVLKGVMLLQLTLAGFAVDSHECSRAEGSVPSC